MASGGTIGSNHPNLLEGDAPDSTLSRWSRLGIPPAEEAVRIALRASPTRETPPRSRNRTGPSRPLGPPAIRRFCPRPHPFALPRWVVIPIRVVSESRRPCQCVRCGHLIPVARWGAFSGNGPERLCGSRRAASVGVNRRGNGLTKLTGNYQWS